MGGEMHCRICGLRQEEPIWGEDGNNPSYASCPCCGGTFGIDDLEPEATKSRREQWLAEGAHWRDEAKKPMSWTREGQLRTVPSFYLQVLPGLPATGPTPLWFNATGTHLHSEGFVVEFIIAGGDSWVGNFEPGLRGLSGVYPLVGHAERALILAKGRAYVVRPTKRTLIETFGAQIADAFLLPDDDGIILGDGLWLARYGPEGRVWTTRRISWDGMMDVTLKDNCACGSAWDPLHDRWVPFEVDLDTGELSGGSYPPELP